MVDIFKELNRIFDEAVPRPVRVRAMSEGHCAYCDQNRDEAMMPAHHASLRCESGGRDHCTCDVCF